ncbi:unnamed protein product [Mytilus edulis]|uniref:Reverse transcriptase/retrotransposon-derived protein RNase H-like domain-containing protein n=1 Tax=Mytilus edulis TaxID=6550 RepID=A0A8S3U543_MYTED|nr:unnamed protein product [Mytilus edulis]
MQSVQNVQLSHRTENESDDSKFLSYFDIPSHLSDTEKSKLSQCLQSNKCLFVTDENPDLGYTDIVHHKICMKSDFKPKNQRPYRLPPDKKEALREHLDELLRQNIIAPVSETEDVPIISPIVLVSKQDRNKKQQENSQKSSANKGIQPPPERLQAIKDYPSPKSVKELRRVVGLLNWFRKYIPNFSSEIEPMTKLLRKNMKFRWSVEQENAFQKLKKLLLNSPVLAFPNYNIPFHLAVDTSSKGIGYVLYQIHTDEHEEDMIRVVRFGSKSLSRWQRSYGPTKLELLGMVTAILDCSVYLRGRRFIVECDHQALKPLFQKTAEGSNL